MPPASKCLCNPPFDSWKSQIPSVLSGKTLLPLESIIKIREEVLKVALEYTESLDTALDIKSEFINRESMMPVIMAGHQPLIYHPGILAKVKALERFTKISPSIALNVSIDIDEGEGGTFLVPRKQGEGISTNRSDIALGRGVYLGQRVKDQSDLGEIYSHVVKSLRSFGYDESARNVEEVSVAYKKLAGHEITFANAAVRRAMTGTLSVLEVPISKVLGLASVNGLLGKLLEDPPTFASKHNSLLDLHRRERKITNLANPFPNLGIYGETVELPLWAINTDNWQRSTISAVKSGSKWVLSAEGVGIGVIEKGKLSNDQPNIGIYPKALLITTLLRYILSDFFVHGMGGAKYDQFTDLFVDNMFGVGRRPFAVVSETIYLFDQEVRMLDEMEMQSRRERELLFHPEKAIGKGVFSTESEVTLSKIITRKREIVDELKAKQMKRVPSGDLTREKHALEKEISQIVASSVVDAKNTDLKINPAMEKIYRTREFPYFYFSGSRDV